MSHLDAQLGEMSKWHGGAMMWRLTKELKYARRVSHVNDGAYDELLAEALKRAGELHKRNGALTDGAVREIEDLLSPMRAACKKYRLLMVGHAHIDMNWMWRYDETVSITLDTFRTALNLMKDFPRFTFAQSQASTYAIVEEHEPEMIEEIRERIQAGQWEVSASTWVEADRNMPSAESVARHFLYTKRYLPKLLGVKADQLNLDYEPDTFGHHQNVPEMLANAGVKFYYHCRGEEGQTLYRWQSPSGAEIVVFLEPDWYLGPISGDEAERVPEFCEKFGIDAALNVYGVGDHGGGPTRRDLERIEDMASWPIYPAVEFGTYAKFYEAADRARAKLPLLTGERNVVFTGCYTTQTRIKQGNRMGERMLGDAEAMNAFAHVETGLTYRRNAFEKAWRGVLFNQFHDIIPGSGVVDTREYAMGLYQEAFSAAASAKRASYAALSSRIDTASLVPAQLQDSTGEGAGVGFGIYDFKPAQVSRGGGPGRVFHLFNAQPVSRKEVVELTLWDYTDDLALIEFVDDQSNVVRHQVLENRFQEYWQHQWTRVVIEAEVPAMGYRTYALRKKGEKPMPETRRADPRVEKAFDMVLENELIRAEFDPLTGALSALTDKATGETLLSGANFRLVEEDPTQGMTSWVVGRYMNVQGVGERMKLKKLFAGPLYTAYQLSVPFGNRSNLSCTISLKAGSPTIEYDVTCDWQERGYPDTYIPQLGFAATLPGVPDKYLYDIPGGVIERDPQALDQPSQGMICAGGTLLMSDSKYGFRGDGDTMSVTLIRSSFDPDPYPENGIHRFRVALGAATAPAEEALLWSHPIDAISGSSHAGDLPPCKSYLEATGARLSAVKLAEDEDALIVRLIEMSGASASARLTFDRPVRAAALVDTLEREISALDAQSCVLEVPMRAHGMAAIKVLF